MDYIHITNLFFSGKHGYFEKERKVEQEFAIEVKLGFDTVKAGKSDKLADTIKKTAVWDNGVPGVTIVRTNK
jgi:FolB domain-containing protein